MPFEYSRILLFNISFRGGCDAKMVSEMELSSSTFLRVFLPTKRTQSIVEPMNLNPIKSACLLICNTMWTQTSDPILEWQHQANKNAKKHSFATVFGRNSERFNDSAALFTSQKAFILILARKKRAKSTRTNPTITIYSPSFLRIKSTLILLIVRLFLGPFRSPELLMEILRCKKILMSTELADR